MIACLTLNPALDVSTSTEEVVPTHKLRCSAARFDPGGGGINVARVVRTLGGDAVALFPAGGHTGAKLIELMQALELPHSAIAIAGGTRQSLTVDEGASGLQYRFVLPGPELSPGEQARCLDALAELRPRPSHLVASGSLPPGVASDFFARLCSRARDLGVKMSLDTSGPALRAAYRGLALMKPSLRELEALVGAHLETTAERVAAARGLVDRGVSELVVVSLGAQGAIWATRSGGEQLPPIPVEQRSAVGAGDSMVAAITLGLARGMPVGDAVRFGMAAGAATVMTPGTDLCRREDVERLLAAAYGPA